MESAEYAQDDTTMHAKPAGIERELQQTTLQAFINSYEIGNRFNDTGPTGITGPITRQPQIANTPGSGGGTGIIFGGGSQAGAPGIAGGTLPLLGTL